MANSRGVAFALPRSHEYIDISELYFLVNELVRIYGLKYRVGIANLTYEMYSMCLILK